MTIPKPKINRSDINPDFQELYDMAIELATELDEKGYYDDDLEHYMFEHVMVAVFGIKYWKWHNKKRS